MNNNKIDQYQNLRRKYVHTAYGFLENPYNSTPSLHERMEKHNEIRYSASRMDETGTKVFFSYVERSCLLQDRLILSLFLTNNRRPYWMIDSY